VRKFAERNLKPLAAKIEAGEYFSEDFIRTLGRSKFLGAPFSISDVGLALGWVSETIVAEEVSAVSGSGGDGKIGFGGAVFRPACIFWK